MKTFDRFLYEAWAKYGGMNHTTALAAWMNTTIPILQSHSIDYLNSQESEAKINFTECVKKLNASGEYSQNDYLYDYEGYYRVHFEENVLNNEQLILKPLEISEDYQEK